MEGLHGELYTEWVLVVFQVEPLAPFFEPHPHLHHPNCWVLSGRHLELISAPRSHSHEWRYPQPQPRPLLMAPCEMQSPTLCLKTWPLPDAFSWVRFSPILPKSPSQAGAGSRLLRCASILPQDADLTASPQSLLDSNNPTPCSGFLLAFSAWLFSACSLLPSPFLLSFFPR